MIVVATGHRPPKLGLDYSFESRKRLFEFAREHLEKLRPCEVIQGCAQGWDSAVAFAAINLAIPVISAVPFEEFNSKWPEDAQKRHQRILDTSAEVFIIGENGYEKDIYIRRDKWMVDWLVRFREKETKCVLALWDGQKSSGTYATVNYALKQGVEVKNLWDEWSRG